MSIQTTNYTTDYFVVASLAHKSKLKTHARKKTEKTFALLAPASNVFSMFHAKIHAFHATSQSFS
jgi:hypothetical protein